MADRFVPITSLPPERGAAAPAAAPKRGPHIIQVDPTNIEGTVPDGGNEVTLTINGKRWTYWDDIEIHMGFDSHASVGFTAPFEPERKEFRETFRPFSLVPVELRVGGELLFTGKLLDVKPNLDAKERTCAISAYSLPGELEFSDPPVSLLPFQTNGLTLRQIAQRVAQPFGFPVMIDGPDSAPFKRTGPKSKRSSTHAEPDQKLHDFLAELAKPTGYVMTSTREGALLFWKSITSGVPVVVLEEGRAPLVRVVPTFSPETYYSEITGFAAAKRGRGGAKYTEQNQRLAGGSLRALNFRLDDTDKGDLPGAVKRKMARMFGQMVSYVIDDLPTWRTPKGDLFEPNKMMQLKAPSAMVYDSTNLLIRDVYLRQKADAQTAALGVVLPGAFSGDQPDRFPWDEPGTSSAPKRGPHVIQMDTTTIEGTVPGRR